ncbi:MAG: hypothetical protein FAF03_00955, partial [Epsilonproteobacteria bacterium]|nr:hypothetical protein [Campylobacterota bacterium]
GEFSSGAVASAVGHVVGEWMMSGDTLKDVVLCQTTQAAVEQQAIAIASAVGGATVLLTQEGVSQEELNRATSMASSVVENNTLQNFGDRVDFASGIILGLGEVAWDNVEGLIELANMPPLEQEQALAMLLPQGLSADETKELNDKLTTLSVVFDDNKVFEGDAYKAGQDLADVAGMVLGAAGIGRLRIIKGLRSNHHTAGDDALDGASVSSNRIFTNRTEYQAPNNGTGNNYIVYQRNIDLDTEFYNPRTRTTTTNRELMSNGNAPFVEHNGQVEQVQLHHSRQDARGPLFEVTESTHNARTNEGREALHPYTTNRGRELNGQGSGERNSLHPNHPVDRANFNRDRNAYWIDRLNNIGGN